MVICVVHVFNDVGVLVSDLNLNPSLSVSTCPSTSNVLYKSQYPSLASLRYAIMMLCIQIHGTPRSVSIMSIEYVG